MFTNIFYMISFFNFPLVIAFDFATLEDQRLFEIILDLIMVADIITEFITTRETTQGKLIAMKDISFAYLKSTFIFDILACIPALVTGEKHRLYFYFKIFRYLQLPRTFEQIDYLVRKAKAHYVVQAIAITNIFMLSKTFFILMILFHTLASMWIFIGNEPGGWRDTVLFEH